MTQRHSSFNVDHGIATIKLNQPDSLNAFTGQMLQEIHDSLIECNGSSEVKVILLTGSGRAFCSGQNLRERVQKPGDPPPNLGDSLRKKYVPIINLIRGSEKPVVCGVNGIAAGAGANLALSCDLIVAKESAYFLQAFSRIGLMPDAGGTFFLTKTIGRQRALGLSLLAEPLTAQDAETLGLIWKCVSDDTFEEEISNLTARLSKGPTLAYAKIKQAISAADSSDLSEALELECVLQTELGFSSDYREGVNAFKEKRTPNFKGK